MKCQDTDSVEVVHVNTGALILAQQIQRIADNFAEQNTAGNGEIVFKIAVSGGKISRFLNFAGKWFPRKSSTRER